VRNEQMIQNWLDAAVSYSITGDVYQLLWPLDHVHYHIKDKRWRVSPATCRTSLLWDFRTPTGQVVNPRDWPLILTEVTSGATWRCTLREFIACEPYYNPTEAHF
jgi:hypothetical protein